MVVYFVHLISYTSRNRPAAVGWTMCFLLTSYIVQIKMLDTSCVVTVYPKIYAHGYCFAVLCCGHTLTDFPISIRLTSLALWQSNDCPSASKATLMNMDKYFMWIHYERLHNHNKAKHNKTVCIFLVIYCMCYDLLFLYSARKLDFMCWIFQYNFWMCRHKYYLYGLRVNLGWSLTPSIVDTHLLPWLSEYTSLSQSLQVSHN